MSEYDDTAEPDFDDPSYADVSALLAGARADGPIPAAVAADLDETLANLVAQRAREKAPTGAVVVPMRRRAWPSRFLVAASTVVLLGAGAVGVTAMLNSSSSDDRAAVADSSKSASREDPAAPEAAAGGGTTSGSTDDAPALADSLNNLSLTYGPGTLASFSSARFPQQAASFVAGTRYLDYQAGVPTSGDAVEPQAVSPVSGSPDAGSSDGSPGADCASCGSDDGMAAKAESDQLLRSYAATTACPGPAVEDGSTVIRIRFAKKPATLVVHPAQGGSQLVEAWSCDGTARLAATTVPAS